jgi:polyphenol oxidase
MSSFIVPDWPAPARVRALMTTRTTSEEEIRAALPASPAWLRQVHGTQVIDLDKSAGREGDAAIARAAKTVCTVKAADCMPVLLADEAGTVVGAAHAGWRGLAAGVLEATLGQMGIPGKRVVAWLGPAIGPSVYEVGDEVRAVFLQHDAAAQSAFSPTRPGHWLLDLYAVARQRLQQRGVEHVFGGGFCTYCDPQRFYSYRRDGTTGRMAAFVWLA